MKVIVYSTRERRELGEIRFAIEWHTARPEAVGKEEIDPDADILRHLRFFEEKEEEAARQFAQDTWDSGVDFYGVVSIQKQRLEWFVEEDGVGEWEDVGDPVYIDSEATTPA